MSTIFLVLLFPFIELGTCQNQHFSQLGLWRNQGISNNVRPPGNIRQRVGENGVQDRFANRNAIGISHRPQLAESNLLERQRPVQSKKIFRPGVSSLPRDAAGNVIRPRAMERQLAPQNQLNTRTSSLLVGSSRPPTQKRLTRLAQETAGQSVDTASQARRSIATVSGMERTKSRQIPFGTRSSKRNKLTNDRPSLENFDPAVFDMIAMTRRMTPNGSPNTSGSGFRVNSPATAVRQTSRHIAASQQQSLSRLNVADTSSAISSPSTSTAQSGRNPFQREMTPSPIQLRIVAPREGVASSDTTRNFQLPNPLGQNIFIALTGQDRPRHEVNVILQDNQPSSFDQQASQSTVSRFFSEVENRVEDPSPTRSLTAERSQQTLGSDRLESARQEMAQRLPERPMQKSEDQKLLAGKNEITGGKSTYEEHISHKVWALLNGEKIDFSLPPGLRADGTNNPSTPEEQNFKPLSLVPARESIQSQISRTQIRANNNLQVSRDNLRASSSGTQDNSLLILSRQNSALDKMPSPRTRPWDDVLNVINTQEQQAVPHSPPDDTNLTRRNISNIPARHAPWSHQANTTNEGVFWWETLGIQDNQTISKKQPLKQIVELEMNGREFGSMVRRTDTGSLPVTTRAPSLRLARRNEESLGQRNSRNDRKSQGSQIGRLFENISNRVLESQANEIIPVRPSVGTNAQLNGKVGRFQERSFDIHLDESNPSEADSDTGIWFSGSNTNRERSGFHDRQLDNGQVDGSNSRQVALGFGRTSRRSESRIAGLHRKRPEVTTGLLPRERLTDLEIADFRARTSPNLLRETGLRWSNGRQRNGDISNAFDGLVNEESRSSDRRSDRSQIDNLLSTIRTNLSENSSPFDSITSQEFRSSPQPSVQQVSPTLSEIQTEPDRISFASLPTTNPSGLENERNDPIRRDRFGRTSERTQSTGGNFDLIRRHQSQNSLNDRDQDSRIRQSEPSKTNSIGGFDLDLFLETLQSESPSGQLSLISNSNSESFLSINERFPTMESGLDFQRSTAELDTNNRLQNNDFQVRTDPGFATDRRENARSMRSGAGFDFGMLRLNDAVDGTSTDVIQPRRRTEQDNLSGRRNGLSRFILPVEDGIRNAGNRLGTLDSVTRSRTQNNEELQEFNLSTFLESVSVSDTPSDSQISDSDGRISGRGEDRKDRSPEPVTLGLFVNSNRTTRERDQTQQHDSPLRGNNDSINEVRTSFHRQPTNDFSNRPRLRNFDSSIMFNRPRLRQQDSFINVQRQAGSTTEDRFQELRITPPASNQRQRDIMLGQSSINAPTITTDPPWLEWLAESKTLTTLSGLTTEQPRNTDIRSNRANQNRWQEPVFIGGQTTMPSLSNSRRQTHERTNTNRQELFRQDRQDGLDSDSAASNRHQSGNITKEFDLQTFLASLNVTQATTSSTTKIQNLNNMIVNSDPISDPSLRLELNALNLRDTAPFSSNSQIPLPIRQPPNNNDFSTNSEEATQSQQDTRDSSFLSDLLGLDVASNILPMGNNEINEIPTLSPTSSSAISRLMSVNTTQARNTASLNRPPTRDSTNSSASQNSQISFPEMREIRISLDGVQSQRNGQNRSTLIVVQIRPDGTVVNNTAGKNPPIKSSGTETLVRTAQIISPLTDAFPPSPTQMTHTTASTQPKITSTTTKVTPGTTNEVMGLRAQLNWQNSLLQELLKSVGDQGTRSKMTKMQNATREVDIPDQNAVSSVEDLKHQKQHRLEQQNRPVMRINSMKQIDVGNSDRQMIQPENWGAFRNMMNIESQEQKLIPTSRLHTGQIIRSNTQDNQILPTNHNSPGLQKRVGNSISGPKDQTSGPNRALGQSQISHKPNQVQAKAKQNEIRHNTNSESNNAMPLTQPVDLTYPLNIEPEIVALRAAFDAALFDKMAMTRTMAQPRERSRTISNMSSLPDDRLAVSNNQRWGSSNSGIQWLGSDGNRQQSQNIEYFSSQISRDSMDDFPRESPIVNEQDVRLAGVEVPGVISKSLTDVHTILPTLQTPSSSPSDMPNAFSHDTLAEHLLRSLQSKELYLALRNLINKVGHDKAVDIMQKIVKSSLNQSTKFQREIGTNLLRPNGKKPMAVRVNSRNPNMLSNLLQNSNSVNVFPLIATTAKPPTMTIPTPTTIVSNIHPGLIADSGPLLEKLTRMHGDIMSDNMHRQQQSFNGERMNMQALDLSTLNGRFHPFLKNKTDSKILKKIRLNSRKKQQPVRIPRVQKKSPGAEGRTLWAAPMYFHATTTKNPLTTESKEGALKMNYLKKELNRLMGLLNTIEL